MMYQLTFDLATFMQDFWQKRPTVLKGGFANFIDPISPDELAGLALEEDIDSRMITNTDGKWTASHGPFEESIFVELPADHWQLIVQAANHWHLETAELVQPFSAIPQWLFDDVMVSYSTQGGGVGPHIDQYDVFIVQGQGKRHWRVGAEDKGQYTELVQASALRQIERFDAIIDTVLEPGDILYIPPGFPHEGYALEESMSYSLGFRSPKEQELVSHLADFYLDRELGDNHVSCADVVLQNNSGEISKDTFQQLRNIIEKSLNDTELLKEFTASLLSQSRHQLDIVAQEDEPQSPADLSECLESGDVLHKLAGLRAFYHSGDTQKIYVNGDEFFLKTPDDTLIPALCNHEMVSADDLNAEGLKADSAQMKLISKLVAKGYWYFNDLSFEDMIEE